MDTIEVVYEDLKGPKGFGQDGERLADINEYIKRLDNAILEVNNDKETMVVKTKEVKVGNDIMAETSFEIGNSYLNVWEK